MLLNKERALAMMKEEKLDALIGTTPENVLYMTGYSGWMPWAYRGNTMERGLQVYAMLTPDGARTLITHILIEIAYYSTYKVEVDDVWAYGTSFVGKPEGFVPKYEDEKLTAELLTSPTRRTVDAVTALIGAMKEKKLTRGRVGIEMFGLAPSAEEKLRDEFPQIEFVDCGDTLCRIRFVKTPDEITMLRRAAWVNERGLQAVMKAIRPGATELEMRRIYKSTIGAEDASQDFFTCSGGHRAGFFAGISDYRYKIGDHVIIDPGCDLDHYHGDSGLICVIGEPTKEHIDMWNKTMEVWQAGMNLIKAGTRPTQIFDTMAALQQKYFGYVGGYFGHGIGVEKRESPLLNRVPGAGQKMFDIGRDYPLETGMVLCIEIPFTRMGFGGVHIEEEVIVTERGYEPLIHAVRDLFVLGT